MRTTRLVIASVAFALGLGGLAFGLSSCAGGGGSDGADVAQQCNEDCMAQCRGQCTTGEDSDAYDDCVSSCDCGCD